MSKHALFLSVCSSVCYLACNNAVEISPSAASPFTEQELKNPTKIIQAMEATLQALPAYSCKLRAEIHLSGNRGDEHLAADYSVRIEQPRRWAIVKESGMIGGTSISDGRRVTNYIPMLQRYAVDELPEEGLGGTFVTGPAEAIGLMGPAALGSFFLGHGLADWMLDGVDESEHLGTELIDGVACQHYRYARAEGSPWELWVQVGEQVRLRRFQMQPEISAADGPMPQVRMSVQLDFTAWETAATFVEADFAFDPPTGASKVKDLFEGAGGPERHRLVGQPAPNFSVSSLEGERFQLADHLGQKVIVLDFWATWCGPCTAALPGLAKVANRFAGRDVLVLAVNQGEQASVVQDHLSNAELELSVLLDPRGSIGQRYAVEGLPTTAVIGKDKRVQVVHVGFSRGMEQQLTSEIEKLLEGEDLAAETTGSGEDQPTDAG